jgi:FKBP-type peptidyl-prolyl cis-trans isomerase FkpA
MKLKIIILLVLCLTIGFVSCDKNDDSILEIVLNDREEQRLADIDSLNKYLATHYYNETYFASLQYPKITDIEIIEVLEGETVPDGYTNLKTAVGEPNKAINAETEYEYYVLELNHGGGDVVTFADNVRINYEGFTLDGEVFDSRGLANPESTLIDLTTVITGWSKVLPEFKTAENYIENSDGTLTYLNSGMGIMFLPSGLAYFPSSSSSLNSNLWYSPLIFKFELLQMFHIDHDGDGIPSYLEDVDDDGNLLDNTDGDTLTNAGFSFEIYNYQDNDDDGDGILTKNEITITTITKSSLGEIKAIQLDYNQSLLNKIKKEQNGSYSGTVITFKDTDGVGVFDYLDKNF